MKFLFIITSFLFCSYAFSAPVLIDRIIAVTGGDNVILESDLDDYKKLIKARKETFTSEQYSQIISSSKNLLDKLIQEHLILEYAKENGYASTEDEIQQLINSRMRELGMSRSQFERQIVLSGQTMEQFKQSIKVDRAKARLFEYELKKRIPTSEDDLKNYFEKKTGESINITEYRIQHILFKTESEAVNIKRQIDAGASFEELAYNFSEDKGTSSNKGDLGFLQIKELLPELKNRVINMSVKEVKGPVKTRLGYHIIKLSELRNIQNPEYVSQKEEIERYFINQEFERQLDIWTERRKDESYVKINL